jgi:hypothetical protein
MMAPGFTDPALAEQFARDGGDVSPEQRAAAQRDRLEELRALREHAERGPTWASFKVPADRANTTANGANPTPERIAFDDEFADALEQEPPALLVPNLLVEHAVNWYSGHPKNLKTTLIAWAALERMRAGQHVVWFDWEMGRGRLRRKFGELGAGTELLREFLHYRYRPPVGPEGTGLGRFGPAMERIAASVSGLGSPLVVFDSAGKALSAAGLSEDSNTETLGWTTGVVIPVRDLPATVAVADHVTKGATRSTPYARGAGTKLADTEVHWYVEATSRPSRSKAGELLLTNHADRDGVLPERVRYAVGDGEGGLPIREVYAGDSDEAGDAGHGSDDLRIQTAILETLDKHTEGDGRTITTNQLEQLVPVRARNGKVASVAKMMAADADWRVQNRPGSRGALEWWSDPLGDY